LRRRRLSAAWGLLRLQGNIPRPRVRHCSS